MRRLTAVVFDFDGVLADSFRVLYGLNRQAMRHAGVTLTERQYRDLFEQNVHLAVRRYFPDATRRRRFLAYKERRFEARYARVRLFPFGPALVRRLARWFRLAVVSSTPVPCIRRLLEKSRLAEHFLAFSGSSAESKAHALRRAMKQLRSVPQATGFVTDTAGDVVVGRRLGLQVLPVGWGFHDERQLREAGASEVFASPRRLLDHLERRSGGRR